MNFLINIFKQSSVNDVLFFLVLASGPTLLWLLFCAWLDRNQPEPKYQIFKTFAIGGLATIPLLIIAGFLTQLIDQLTISSVLSVFVLSFLIDGCVEEIAKYIVLRIGIVSFEYFDELKDGMIYGMILGLGFAFVENVLYGVSVGVTEGFSLVISRGFSTTLVHFLTGGIIGFFITWSLVYPKKRKYMSYFGVLISVLVHGSYNVVTRLGWTWGIAFPILILISVYAFIFTRLRSTSL